MKSKETANFLKFGLGGIYIYHINGWC